MQSDRRRVGARALVLLLVVGALVGCPRVWKTNPRPPNAAGAFPVGRWPSRPVCSRNVLFEPPAASEHGRERLPFDVVAVPQRDDTFGVIVAVRSYERRGFELFVPQPGAVPELSNSAIVRPGTQASSFVKGFSNVPDHLQFCYYAYGGAYFGIREHHGGLFIESASSGSSVDSERLTTNSRATFDVINLSPPENDLFGVAWIDESTLKVRKWWISPGVPGRTVMLATDAQASAGISMARNGAGGITLAYSTGSRLVILQNAFASEPARVEYPLEGVREIRAVTTLSGDVDVFVIAGTGATVHLFEQTGASWSTQSPDPGPARNLRVVDAAPADSGEAQAMWILDQPAFRTGDTFPQHKIAHVKEIARTWTGVGDIRFETDPTLWAEATAVSPFRLPSSLAVVMVSPDRATGQRTQVAVESSAVIDQSDAPNTTWKWWRGRSTVTRNESYPTTETPAVACARTRCYCAESCRAAFSDPALCVPRDCKDDCRPPGRQSCVEPAARTCAGSEATAEAQYRVVLAEAPNGCADGVTAFANTVDEAKSCIESTGLAPVARICRFEVLLSTGPNHYVYPVSASGEKAVSCAKVIGGCSNCTPSVSRTLECTN